MSNLVHQIWSCDRDWYTDEVRDERLDRLLRAAWIVTYKRQQGEYFSELHEKRFIRKHLRYAQTNVYWKHKLEKNGRKFSANFSS